MVSRTYLFSALILWLASTTWLVTSKILPALTTGKPPDYSDLLPRKQASPEPVMWQILWNGENIGWAQNQISRRVDGTGTLRSEVQFEQLPVDRILKDVLGVLGTFTTALRGEIGPLELRVLTTMNFDHLGYLTRFETDVDVGGMEGLMQIQGHVLEEKLSMTASVNIEGQPREIVTKKEIHLPAESIIADSFSPRPRFSKLRVGQKWTFQSYRPLMPHRPMELIEASVEQEELLEWNGRVVKARKVVYRRDAGSGLSSTRRPMSEIWVARDGTVLRQDLWLANVRIQFLRAAAPITPPNATSSSAGSP